MKEYKIWKFIPGKYLQTVTVSLEEEYPCKQKRCGYSCLGDKTEHVCFVKANLSFEEREIEMQDFVRVDLVILTSVVLCIVLVLISHFVIEHVYKENNISGI